jgi:hypothetical protein
VIDFFDTERGSITLLKRYSDFDKLHKNLKSQAPKNIKIPAMPPKRFFGDNTDKSFVNSRCSRLEGYLNDLLSHADALLIPCLNEFLHEEAQLQQLDVSASTKSPSHSPRKSPRPTELVSQASWSTAAPSESHHDRRSLRTTRESAD